MKNRMLIALLITSLTNSLCFAAQLLEEVGWKSYAIGAALSGGYALYQAKNLASLQQEQHKIARKLKPIFEQLHEVAFELDQEQLKKLPINATVNNLDAILEKSSLFNDRDRQKLMKFKRAWDLFVAIDTISSADQKQAAETSIDLILERSAQLAKAQDLAFDLHAKLSIKVGKQQQVCKRNILVAGTLTTGLVGLGCLAYTAPAEIMLGQESDGGY